MSLRRWLGATFGAVILCAGLMAGAWFTARAQDSEPAPLEMPSPERLEPLGSESCWQLAGWNRYFLPISMGPVGAKVEFARPVPVYLRDARLLNWVVIAEGEESRDAILVSAQYAWDPNRRLVLIDVDSGVIEDMGPSTRALDWLDARAPIWFDDLQMAAYVFDGTLSLRQRSPSGQLISIDLRTDEPRMIFGESIVRDDVSGLLYGVAGSEGAGGTTFVYELDVSGFPEPPRVVSLLELPPEIVPRTMGSPGYFWRPVVLDIPGTEKYMVGHEGRLYIVDPSTQKICKTDLVLPGETSATPASAIPNSQGTLVAINYEPFSLIDMARAGFMDQGNKAFALLDVGSSRGYPRVQGWIGDSNFLILRGIHGVPHSGTFESELWILDYDKRLFQPILDSGDNDWTPENRVLIAPKGDRFVYQCGWGYESPLCVAQVDVN